jgi:hypothetical protein
MAEFNKDIINELLILQKKVDTIFKECLTDSMNRPLLWFQDKDTFYDITLAKLKAEFLSKES